MRRYVYSILVLAITLWACRMTSAFAASGGGATPVEETWTVTDVKYDDPKDEELLLVDSKGGVISVTGDDYVNYRACILDCFYEGLAAKISGSMTPPPGHITSVECVPCP